MAILPAGNGGTTSKERKGETVMKRFMGTMVMVMALVVCIGGASAGQKQDEAKALVKKAVVFLKENGKEKAFAEFSNPTGKFVKGELYILVFDPKGTMLAHGANQKLIGKDLFDMKDADGNYLTRDIINVAKKGGGWTSDYKWTNPVSKKIETKITYVEPVGDLAVGCGIYK
jgi:cytochrome c